MTRRHPSFSQRHLPETSPAPSPLRPAASSTSTDAYIAMAGATHVKKPAANTRAEIGHASNELVTATPAVWEQRFMGLVLPGNYSPPAGDPRVAITSPFEHACLAILHQDHARLVLTVPRQTLRSANCLQICSHPRLCCRGYVRSRRH